MVSGANGAHPSNPARNVCKTISRYVLTPGCGKSSYTTPQLLTGSPPEDMTPKSATLGSPINPPLMLPLTPPIPSAPPANSINGTTCKMSGVGAALFSYAPSGKPALNPLPVTATEARTARSPKSMKRPRLLGDGDEEGFGKAS